MNSVKQNCVLSHEQYITNMCVKSWKVSNKHVCQVMNSIKQTCVTSHEQYKTNLCVKSWTVCFGIKLITIRNHLVHFWGLSRPLANSILSGTIFCKRGYAGWNCPEDARVRHAVPKCKGMPGGSLNSSGGMIKERQTQHLAKCLVSNIFMRSQVKEKSGKMFNNSTRSLKLSSRCLQNKTY